MIVKPSNQPPASRLTRQVGWSIAIFALALIVRGVHLWQISEAPFFSVKMIDALSYDDMARQIAGGDWLGNEVFFQAPLYPYVLGAIYRVFGDDVFVVRLIQAVIGSLSCVLLAAAGARWFSRPAGVTAGVMLALYPPAIFFDSLIQKAGLGLFLLCLVLWILGRIVDRPKSTTLLGLGAALGFLILTRENALLFVPVILVWLAVRFHGLGMRPAVMAAMLLIGLAIVLTPVAVRNWYVGGEFHLTTSQFGPNFFVGNSERADGTYKPIRFGRADMREAIEDYVMMAEQNVGRKLTRSEVSSYYMQRAVHFIRTHPGDWLGLMGRKFMLTWNAVEIADTEDQYSFADWSLPLRWTDRLFHFGVLAPLASLGIWVTWRQRKRVWLLYVMALAYTAGIVLFYVFARYRLPLVPFLIVFAAAGVAGLCERVITYARGVWLAEPGEFDRNALATMAGSVVTVLIVALFCNLPGFTVTSKDRMRAVTHNNVGAALIDQQRYEEAAGQYHAALELEPGYAEALFNLGLVFYELDRFDEAIEQFEMAIHLRPIDPDARFALAVVYHRRGRLDDAIKQYREVLKQNPGHAGAKANLDKLRHSGDPN